MPMPVSATGDPIAAVFLPMPRINGYRSTLRKLVRIAHEVQQRLAQSHLVRMHRSYRGVATDRHPVLVLRCQRLDRLDHVVDERREREVFELELHEPGLDLGEVEDIVYGSKPL